MHIVAHRGAVGGRIVVAEDRKALARMHGRADGQGDGVGLRVVSLADAALRISAGGVEIAQSDGAEAGSGVQVAQDLLDHQF